MAIFRLQVKAKTEADSIGKLSHWIEIMYAAKHGFFPIRNDQQHQQHGNSI